VFFERVGQVGLAGARFESEAALDEWVRAIAARAGRPIDDRRPMLDARLPDGSRVNAILPPLSLRGPCVTIRRFPRERLSGDQLVEVEALTRPMLDFLRASVAARLSLLVSGGTGSGKTTLLNALAASAGADERVVTIEDAAELRLPQRHVLPLETRPPDAAGHGEVTVRDLVRNALRMRPDRIVVGEVRGAEALDMLQAMNTGHEGSLSTIHANSPREALSRLETLVLFAGTELPVRAVREQIAGAIPLIVHVARTSGGRRRVTSITELTGLEGDRFTLGEIFRFDPADGTFHATGYVPRCRERLVERGQSADPTWFRD
jgi:pilus assembly protein CpaF